MIERIVTIDGIDPVVILGPQNSQIDKIQSLFPKLKIVSRGNEIKCMGEEEEVSRFVEKMDDLLHFAARYNKLTEEDIDNLLLDPEHRKGVVNGEYDDVLVFGPSGKGIKARTVNQLRMVSEYRTCDLLIAEGPAGTGKTFMAIALAVRALKNREVKKIILSRPAVEAGERLGFLPGDLREKLDPYLQPLYDALNDMVPFRKLESWFEEGTIQIVPLAFMRGRTLENAFVILDEAQNATINQLKMFLTRMGSNSKFIITGDTTQIDLPKRSDSGLYQAIQLLGDIEGIGVVPFDDRDIVRHKLVKKIVKAYEDGDERNGSGNNVINNGRDNK